MAAAKYPTPMLKRIRHLHISLAAKCQLLFGAAVVLIIAAALFVPWQRMEQLTAQLNERSARTLIEYAIDAHVANPRGLSATTATATTQPSATTAPTDSSAATTRAIVLVAPPTTAPIGNDEPMTPPRLLLVGSRHDDNALTRFERKAIRHLAERGHHSPISEEYETPDGGSGYRFARAEASCVNCHKA